MYKNRKKREECRSVDRSADRTERNAKLGMRDWVASCPPTGLGRTMIKGLWNYAVKAYDIEKTATFYTDIMGASLMFRGEVYGCNYILIRLGDTRVIVFDRAPYEEDLNLDLPPGFLHAVYEVDDFEAKVESLRQSGVKFIMEPRILEGLFGMRKIAFFEAPDGTRVEVMQVLRDSGRAG
jgi:catechol 2,3-dioxygenase-like lactoylglutathione lyase family enzyme